MEKKSKCVKVGFSTILLTVLAILLCTAPCVWAEDININEPVQVDLYVLSGTTVNLSANVSGTIWVEPDSHLNIHSGDVGGLGVVVLNPIQGEPDAVVTVYGTAFSVDGVPIDPTATEFTPVPPPVGDGTAVLTVNYENGGDPINLLFISDIPINLVNTATSGPDEITIDIKPGSDTNTINLGLNGVIPVAILSEEGFDATMVPPENVFLAGLGVRVRGKGNKYLASEEDVNGDGLMDLVVKVETVNLDPGQFAEGGAYLQVHETSDPTSTVLYEGWDEIVIVPPE